MVSLCSLRSARWTQLRVEGGQRRLLRPLFPLDMLESLAEQGPALGDHLCGLLHTGDGYSSRLYGGGRGGIHTLVETTISNARAQGVNQYSLQFEDGPRVRLLQTFLVISPVGLLFAVPGMLLAWRRDQSERDLVHAEARGDRFHALQHRVSLAAMFTPHRLNLRYLCMVFGPLYLLSGLGFWWLALFIGDRLDGFERRLFQSFAVLVVLLGAAIDLATFHRELSAPTVVDLSAKMLLGRDGPVRATLSHETRSPAGSSRCGREAAGE